MLPSDVEQFLNHVAQLALGGGRQFFRKCVSCLCDVDWFVKIRPTRCPDLGSELMVLILGLTTPHVAGFFRGMVAPMQISRHAMTLLANTMAMTCNKHIGERQSPIDFLVNVDCSWLP
jgi:hypothetical protein